MSEKLKTCYDVQKKYFGPHNKDIDKFYLKGWGSVLKDCFLSNEEEAKMLSKFSAKDGWKYRVVELQRRVVGQYE